MGDKYLDISKAAELLGKTERHVRRLCVGGKLHGAKRKGGRWQVPPAADSRLAGVRTPDQLTESADMAGVPETKRQQAYQRLGYLREFERFAREYLNHGGKRTVAVTIYAEQQGIGRRSLQRWYRKYRESGIIGLIDMRGGAFVNETISDEAWELFKSMYLTAQQLTVKTCLQNINYINISQERGWNVPGLRFMQRYVKTNIPEYVRILHREGTSAYDAKCAPYILTDPETIEPGAVWIGDHHQFNCWIRHRGKWVRPWLTAWEDKRSRVIVGVYVSASPNQTTIMQAMRRGIKEYGPPESVKIDNGKDYDSELWTGTTKARRRAINKGYIDEKLIAGIYAMMDIGVSFSIPYHPQSKPIERFFDTLDKQFTKTIKTYCGKDAKRRPDDLFDYLKTDKAINQACDLEGFADLVEKYIDTYNRSAHKGEGMDQRTPLAVLKTRQTRRVIAEGVLELTMRVWSGELKVGKNGVRFKGLWYGQYDADLLARQGKKVRLAYDPDDISQVHVYDATTMSLITVAQQAKLVGYGSAVSEDDLREASRQKARAKKAANEFRDTRLTANMDLVTLTLRARQNQIVKDTTDEPETAAAIKPVATPFDDQVELHKKVETRKAVRKAAGGENICCVPNIDISALNTHGSGNERGPNIDISALSKPETGKVRLFDV